MSAAGMGRAAWPGDRRRWLLPAAGVLMLVLLPVLGLAGVRVMPSYLSAWLFVLSVPVGALLLATGIEAFSDEADAVGTLLAPLRRLLPLLPPLAVCGVPVLLAHSLSDPQAWSGAGFGRGWFAHGVSGLRGVLFLLLWSGLALVFAAPGTRRRLAGLAFAAMLVTGTLAAFDWAMSAEPGLASSSFGLLLLSGQAVSAASLAILLAGRDARAGFAIPVLVLLWVWAFLHFTQFLVVWSANQPDEAAWYLHRLGGLGEAAIWLGALLPVLALGLLPVRAVAQQGWPVPLVAAFALLVQLLQNFWLVTPAFRGRFTLTLADGVAAGGLVALAAGLWWAGMLPWRGRMADGGR